MPISVDIVSAEGSCFESRSECAIELRMCCCSEVGQTKSHVHDFVIVSRGLEREIDSVKAIGSKDVGAAV